MITVPQLRAARAILGWSQDDLASRSGVSKPTIARLELGTGSDLGGYQGTRDKLQNALEAAGVEFIAENGGGPGVRMRKGIPKVSIKASGPATDAVKAMETAINEHRKSRKPKG